MLISLFLPSRLFAVRSGFGEKIELLERYDAIADRFAEPDADFDALITEQAEVRPLMCCDLASCDRCMTSLLEIQRMNTD